MKSWRGSLYLVLAEEITVSSQIRAIWEKLRENDCSDSFKADAKSNFFTRTCCQTHKKHNKREPGLLKEEFRCPEMLCLCSKTYCCYDYKSDKFIFISKGLNKRVLDDSGYGVMAIHRRVLDEAINLASTNRGLRTINLMVATYEQTKERLGYFYPKRQVQDNGNLTKPLKL